MQSFSFLLQKKKWNNWLYLLVFLPFLRRFSELKKMVKQYKFLGYRWPCVILWGKVKGGKRLRFQCTSNILPDVSNERVQSASPNIGPACLAASEDLRQQKCACLIIIPQRRQLQVQYTLDLKLELQLYHNYHPQTKFGAR